MKKLFTVILTFLAMNSYAQNMIINKTDGSSINRLPLMELYQTTHSTDAEGTSSVTADFLNGASYTCNTTDVESFKVIKKDDMLKEGKFANMKLVKTFDSVQDLEEGDLIGIVDEKDYDYDEFFANAYYAFSDTCTESLVQSLSSQTRTLMKYTLNAKFTLNVANLANTFGITSSYIRYHVTDIVYAGRDIDGSLIPLSGRIIYPYYSPDPSGLSISNIFVEQHTTLFEDNREPSSRFYTFSCAADVYKGYMVIQPDLLGFGVSKKRSQMFVNCDINGSSTADCVIAAMQYADLTKTDPSCRVNLSSDATIISAGSSQGASSALGFTYYWENKLPSDKAASMPKISESRLCAGAYNPQKTFEEFVQRDSIYGFLVPLIAVTASVGCPDYMQYTTGEPIFPYDILTPSLKDMTWTGLEAQDVPANMTVWQLLNNKKGNFTVFTQMFSQAFPYDKNTAFASFKKIIADGMTKVDESGNTTLNYDDERVAALIKYFSDSNLCDNTLWTPKSDVTMLHAVNDETVPYINSLSFFSTMLYQMTVDGHSLSLTSYENTSNISHTMICCAWMIAEITDMDVESVLNLLALAS